MNLRYFAKIAALALPLISTSSFAAAKKKPAAAKKAPIATQPSETTPADATDPITAPMPASETLTPASTGAKPSPFAANPSPFGDLLDQTSLPTEPAAKILRASKPFFGASYLMASGSYKSSLGSLSGKDQLDASSLALEFIYPTPMGVRVGAYYSQIDIKLKSSGTFGDSTVKAPITSKGILAAAAFQNGIGLGLSFNDVEEKLSIDGVSIDEHYGYILPSVYFANKTDEITLAVRRSMRHKTGTANGYFDLGLEHSFGSMNGVFKLRNNRRSENSDNRRDNYEIGAGLRYFLEQKSNILATIEFEEPFYNSPNDASAFSVAETTLSVSTDYWVAPEHVVGGGLSYAMSQGRGSEVGGERAKFDGSTLTFGASYSYRM